MPDDGIVHDTSLRSRVLYPPCRLARGGCCRRAAVVDQRREHIDCALARSCACDHGPGRAQARADHPGRRSAGTVMVLWRRWYVVGGRQLAPIAWEASMALTGS